MNKKRILIVEDEGVLALRIQSDLEETGYAVVGIHASGEEALEGIRAAGPDLVLMDINIQGKMDGIETAGRIKKDYDVPVIYLTAHSGGNTIERAKITEPYGYILKPFNAKELRIIVEVALYKHKMDQEKAQLTRELQKAHDELEEKFYIHKKIEAERENLIVELQEAISNVKQLSGLLPTCACCKKIRDDKGYWNQIETYISEHSEALFSHAICPECGEKLYPQYYDEIWGKQDKEKGP